MDLDCDVLIVVCVSSVSALCINVLVGRNVRMKIKMKKQKKNDFNKNFE